MNIDNKFLQNINASYTIELDPDIQNHDVGFKLPPEEIKPVGESFYTFNTFNVCVNAKSIYLGKKMLNALRHMADEMDSMYPHLLS